MIDIFSKFPQYCESATNFWLHEPLNAITNLAFIIGAYYLFKLIKKEKLSMPLGLILLSLMIILGLGSLAWHSYRSLPTLLLDEIPIYIFIIFAGYYLTQTLTRSHKITLMILASISAAYYLIFAYIPGINISNGVLKYIFALLIFLVLSTFIVKKFGSGYNFILSFSIFAVAIIFRIIDLFVCSNFPIGTHFVWHILVAMVMYLVSITILRLHNKQSKSVSV